MKKIKWFFKTFAGFGLNILNIDGTRFDGYGFELLGLQWNRAEKITYTRHYFLLRLNIYIDHGNRGRVLRISGSFLFAFSGVIYKKVLAPPKDRCDWCEEYCETKEHYHNGVPLCSEECRKWWGVD